METFIKHRTDTYDGKDVENVQWKHHIEILGPNQKINFWILLEYHQNSETSM